MILCLEKNGSTVLRMTFLFNLSFSSYSSKTNYQVPAIKSFSYHLCHICDTSSFHYISYTDVPCWSYFDLTSPEMGRSRQKTTLALFEKSASLQKPILLLSCSWEVFLAALAASSLPLIGLHIRTKWDQLCSGRKRNDWSSIPTQIFYTSWFTISQ